MITATTDKQPIYLGKPSKEVVKLCLEVSGFTPEETLVVGDRLYTDIPAASTVVWTPVFSSPARHKKGYSDSRGGAEYPISAGLCF